MTRVERVQSLWGGYGELVRATLDGERTVIVKHVKPPAHARSSASDARKRRSYDVELAFYRDHASLLDEQCRVARCLASRAHGDEWVLVLEDLDAAGYALRSDHTSGAQLMACLGWLAAFHARFVGHAPRGLWPIGTCWHLDTRRDELANIRDASLRASAAALDAQLANATYQTLVHGDAKDANFCFARDHQVAAVDFQYVGRGVGVRDLVYLLDDRRDAAALIDAYFGLLRAQLAPAIDAAALEAEWRSLVPVAQRDLARFYAGWRG